MTHTEDLIFRLRSMSSRGVSSWGDLQQEAADHIAAQDLLIAVLKKQLPIAVAAERAAIAKAEERNFCPRCGKRTADLTTVHTCTPPQEKNNG